ncbi:RNA-guided endonuclease IscB [Bacillus mexicanus]|uniref:RNA-guided endonuclease IscB n=1 Tax=Bacillus mexicanus TaxID=2834415 RepID=UPI003D1B67F2
MWTYHLYGELSYPRGLIYLVYVVSKNGNPLNPTNPAKARKLLKSGKAKAITTKPFTIQLQYETPEYTQPFTLGIDSDYSIVGFSVISKDKEIICGEVKLLQGIKNRLEERRLYRRMRRNHLRYRKPRFENRKRREGWLGPSLQHKLDSHIRFIEKMKRILPIKNVIVEITNFNVQKIKNSTFQEIENQLIEQYGFSSITYGFKTKAKRNKLGLDKTPHNDAFIVAGGLNQERCTPLTFTQVRRNNRSLERFRDAKYIDIRTGKQAPATELSNGRKTRNKNKNTENLRCYRGKKVLKGMRIIRHQRYFYQPNDLVKFNGHICKVIGTINKGKSVRLDIGKNPNPAKLNPYRFAKGIVAV